MKRLMILTMCVIFVAGICFAAMADNNGIGQLMDKQLKGRARAIEAHTLNRGEAKANGIPVEDLPTGKVSTIDEYGRITSVVVETSIEPYVSYSINVVYHITDPTCTVTFMHEYLAEPVVFVTSYTVPDTAEGEWSIGEEHNGPDEAYTILLKWQYIDPQPAPHYTKYIIDSRWDNSSLLMTMDGRQKVEDGWFRFEGPNTQLIIDGTPVYEAVGRHCWMTFAGGNLIWECYLIVDANNRWNYFSEVSMRYYYDAEDRKTGGYASVQFGPTEDANFVYVYDSKNPQVLRAETWIGRYTGETESETIYEYDRDWNLTTVTTERSCDLGGDLHT